MFDSMVNRLIAPFSGAIAEKLTHMGITPDAVTLTGFCIGMAAVPMLWSGRFTAALLLILFNRICDGLDGALARRTAPSDAGAFLDITLDFIFYSGIIFGFALADPARNGLWAALLIFSFVGTGSSFLAFATMAAKHGFTNSSSTQTKSMYYLEGLTEGTETILFFILICLFPSYFPQLAIIFSILCWITTITRVIGGYRRLRASNPHH